MYLNFYKYRYLRLEIISLQIPGSSQEAVCLFTCGVDELRRNSSTLRGRLLDDSVGEVTWKEGERGVKVEEVEMMRGWECCLVR